MCMGYGKCRPFQMQQNTSAIDTNNLRKFQQVYSSVVSMESTHAFCVLMYGGRNHNMRAFGGIYGYVIIRKILGFSVPI